MVNATSGLLVDIGVAPARGAPTLHGSARLAGAAVVFPPSGAPYVSLGSLLMNGGRGDATYAVWARYAGGASPSARIFDTSSGSYGLYISVADDSSPGGSTAAYSEWQGSEAAGAGISQTGVWQLGAWTHVVVVRSLAACSLSLYASGVIVANTHPQIVRAPAPVQCASAA